MKHQGWELLLDEHLEQAYRAPFEWGQNDCAIWSAEWVRKATGVDLAQPWRGQYSSETELATLLEDRGYDSPASIADEALPAIPVALAQRGDILQDPKACLGICNGKNGYFLGHDAVITIRTLSCTKAWKVG
ncbi:hypothetical protein BH10PLA2_BH10PLA2_00730 [soil metagenome]